MEKEGEKRKTIKIYKPIHLNKVETSKESDHGTLKKN